MYIFTRNISTLSVVLSHIIVHVTDFFHTYTFLLIHNLHHQPKEVLCLGWIVIKYTTISGQLNLASRVQLNHSYFCQQLWIHISCILIYTVKFFYKNTRCNARGIDLVIYTFGTYYIIPSTYGIPRLLSHCKGTIN